MFVNARNQLALNETDNLTFRDRGQDQQLGRKDS